MHLCPVRLYALFSLQAYTFKNDFVFEIERATASEANLFHLLNEKKPKIKKKRQPSFKFLCIKMCATVH